jgi:hypothetical protein
MKTKGIPKFVIYLLLIIFTSVPLFFSIPVPGQPVDASADAFKALMNLKEGDEVLLASDWTGSTRGESMAHMKSILRILMRKRAKVAIWSTADPQAPRVAQDVMTEIAKEHVEVDKQPAYKRWDNWVIAGFYPNSDVAINAVAKDIRNAFSTRKETNPEGKLKSIFESPVMKNIKTVGDFDLIIDVTASKTSDFHVQFLSAKKVPLLFAVTGVMVPETQVFYNSGQCVGFLGGLKGVFDLEQMMENGLNIKGADGKVLTGNSKITDEIPGFKGMSNKGSGTKYYPTLHFALLLMIVLIIIGNVEMFKAKKGAQK